MKTLIKVLVGSRAHGLHNEESDYDYRGVYIAPTSEVLSLGRSIKNTQWIEGKQDDTSWEVGKFLHLATKCNPTVLEVFKAPIIAHGDREPREAPLSSELRNLFKYVWNPTDVRNAFVGYGLNQRKKFLNKNDNRPNKYATAYLRTLYEAHELLSTGDFQVSMVGTPVFEQLKRFKAGDYEVGEVIQTCIEWEEKVDKAYEKCPKSQITNKEKVNEFLLKIRKENW